MLNLKKMVSALLGVTMVANMALSMPTFADETTGCTYAYDGYEVSYDVTNSWGNTDVVSITLTNTGDEIIENWMMYFDPNGDVQYTTNAEQKATADGITYFKNSGYNADVAPNSSVTFGYAVNGCEDAPDFFTLCQKRKTKTDGYAVSLNVNQSWGDSFNGEIIIQNNTDTAIESWELTIDTNFTITEITNSWAATITELKPCRYQLKGTYTGTVAANSSVSLGFIGVKDGEPEISSYSLTEQVVDDDAVYRASYGTGYTTSDLEKMNEGSYYPLDVQSTDNGVVYSIDGKFSNILVTDEKSALNSLYGVKELLGMTDPQNELELDYIYDSSVSDYKSYFFNQVYQGIWVYGRNVTVVARDYGDTMSLDSSYIGLKNISVDPTLSETEIEEKYDSNDAELVVYTYDEFESNPTLAYVFDSGSETYVVSAETGDTIQIVENTVTEEDTADALTDTSGEILYDQSGNLCHSKGSFYTDKVESSEDARKVIDSADLSIDFTSGTSLNTLTFANEQNTDYKTTYHFNQFYSGVRVFGRQISVSARKSNSRILSFDSNVVTIGDDFNIIPSFSKPTEDAELVIYTWDEDENDATPRLAYIYDDVSVKGEEKTVIKFGEDEYLYKSLGKGVDEGCYVNTSSTEDSNYEPRAMKLQYFPITYNEEYGNYKLSVKKYDIGIGENDGSKIEIRHTEQNGGVGVTNETINSNSTYFYAPEAVSTYMNAMAVNDWYANESGLNRSQFVSATNKNLNINKGDVIIGIDSTYFTDNAYFTSNYICICAKSIYNYTDGASLDIIGHEYTHGVFSEFAINKNTGMVKGINEGYADVFGNFIDDTNWMHGESVKGNSVSSSRIASNPPTVKVDFDSSVSSLESHSCIPYITYPAYLMNEKYEIDSLTLCKLYYASMSQGRYSSTSSLNSVRINVLKAAKALNLTQEELAKITSAFDEIWNMDNTTYSLTINAVDCSTTDPISGATITIKEVFAENPSTISMTNGTACTVKPGWYTLTIEADGYIGYQYNMYMNYRDTTMRVRLVSDNSEAGTLTICTKDYVSRLPVDSTVVITRVDVGNSTEIGEYQTGSAVGANVGYTTRISVMPGYYTISVNGAKNYFLKSVIVAPGANQNVDVDYYDIGVDQNETTDIFTFSTIEYKEDSIASSMSIGIPKLDHSFDSFGNRIAYSSSSIIQFGRSFNVYCYERQDQTYSVRYGISQKQYDALSNIVEYENNRGEKYIGKYYNLEIQCDNAQNSENTYTITVTASDILNSCVQVSDEYYFEFAKIEYSTTDGAYVITSNL